MEEWRRILAESIVKPKDLADRFGLDENEIEAIVGPYPMRITPTVLGTIKEKGDEQGLVADVSAHRAVGGLGLVAAEAQIGHEGDHEEGRDAGGDRQPAHEFSAMPQPIDAKQPIGQRCGEKVSGGHIVMNASSIFRENTYEEQSDCATDHGDSGHLRQP